MTSDKFDHEWDIKLPNGMNKTENKIYEAMKAIEHWIISELLRNDFEVYVPALDEGVDFICRDK
ncbi:MAG: hypothetical protein AABY07_00670 [Nanoarchaeota archaeon]